MFKRSLIASTIVVIGFSFADAAEKSEKPSPPESINTAAAKKKEQATQQLLDGLRNTLVVPEEDRTEERFPTAAMAGFGRALEAANAALARPDLDESQLEAVIAFKVGVLGDGIRMFDIPGYRDELEGLNKELAKSKPKSLPYILANLFLIEARHRGPRGKIDFVFEHVDLGPLRESALPEVEKFIDAFAGEEIDDIAILMLFEIATEAERNHNIEIAKRAYQLANDHFGDGLSTASVSATVLGSSLNEILDGCLRRIDLIGKPIKLSGSTIKGEPLDIASLKGKVVLIHFWDPCWEKSRDELPQLKEACDKHHAKGFEIIGIPYWDDDKEDLKQSVEEQNLPWTQLYGKRQTTRGQAIPGRTENSIATYYSMDVDSPMFLIDRSGNVVSTTMTAAKLDAKLKELLGDTDARKATDAPK